MRTSDILLVLALAGCRAAPEAPAAAGDVSTAAPADSAAPADAAAPHDASARPPPDAAPAPVVQDRDGDGWPDAVDCQWGYPAIHPGAPELCNGLDDDCDGEVDEGVASVWYPDADGDGYGADASAVEACEAPGPEWGATGGDCDDTDAAVAPGMVEACDGVDTDCDGVTPAEEADDDGDGWTVCAGDCDDGDPRVSPGTVEVCGASGWDDCADAGCVDCDRAVPNDHATIQDAIDAAADGEVVCVGAGTWAENVDFGGAAITVVGVHGAGATTIDGGGTDVVARFDAGEGADSELRGFTLQNGYGWYGGGGVYVSGASPTLRELVVTGNGAPWEAAGVYVEDGAPSLIDVRVTENLSYAWYCAAGYGTGGGIGLVRSDAVLEGVTVTDNEAGMSAGGVYVEEGAPALTNVRVHDNQAGYYGGGVYLYGTNATLTNVRVEDNGVDRVWGPGSDPTGFGGGIMISGGAPTLTNVTVRGNDDALGIGGVYTYRTDAQLVNVLVTDNNGGVYHHSGSAPDLAYCDVWGNGTDYTTLPDPTGTDGNVSVNPALLASGQLDAGSPLQDAGDPSLLDPDGSRSDIGAFGGPGAESWDADHDGWPAWWAPGAWDATTSPGTDCDDDDAGVYPGSGC